MRKVIIQEIRVILIRCEIHTAIYFAAVELCCFNYVSEKRETEPAVKKGAGHSYTSLSCLWDSERKISHDFQGVKAVGFKNLKWQLILGDPPAGTL